MADLNELNLQDDPIETPDELPEERAVRVPILQPCVNQIFQLPEKIDFDTFQVPDVGQRLMVKFTEFPAKTYPEGVPVKTTVNNLERTRKTKDGKEVKVNDLAYLIRALGFTGPLRNNPEYARAMAQYASHFFVADWELSARCNPKRDIYRDGAQVKGRSGCGQEYGMRERSYTDRNGKKVTVLQLPREKGGAFKENFDCEGTAADGKPCGANLYVNGNWRNFKAAPTA